MRVLLGCVALSCLVGVLFFSSAAKAVQTVPYKVNFQGALSNASGVPLADGQYNMTFRLYTAATGGSQVWSEVRQTTNRVTVADGMFSVQLGDVSALSPSLFTSQPLYFEVELPTPATATCEASDCASYSEGPMSPRQSLGASPYAVNADLLDGYDATDFVIGSQTNIFTGANLFKNTANSSDAFSVRAADDLSLFKVDTSNDIVTIGSTTRQTESSTFGLTVAGPMDFDDYDELNMSRHLTGATAGEISSMSAFIGDLDAAPYNKYKLAIYSGTVSSPGTLIAGSGEGIATAGWNTVPITATLSPNTYYWLAYITNGRAGTNNLGIIDGGQSYQPNYPNYDNNFPTTPPVESGVYYPQTLSMYATYEGGATINPAFTVDSQDRVVQIGSTAPSADVVVLILDSKSTAADPVGANGAMYYNNSLAKFRCYEAGVWRDCFDGAGVQQVAARHEFMTANVSTDDSLFVSGTGATLTSIAAVANHPGIATASSGSTATGVAGWRIGTGSALTYGGGTRWNVESVIRLPTLSANPQIYVFQSGYVNTTTGAPTAGCYISYTHAANSGRFEGVCLSGGSSTTCDTAIAVSANQWYKTKTVVNATGTAADFYIDDVLKCSVTTNITTAVISPMVGIRKTSGTTARTLDIDYASNTGSNILR